MQVIHSLKNWIKTDSFGIETTAIAIIGIAALLGLGTGYFHL